MSDKVSRNIEALRLSGRTREALRVWIVREMLEHRQIEREDLSVVTGMSLSRISSALSGGAYLDRGLNGDKLLDRIENAITILCDARGWVCRCSDAYLDEIREVLSKHAYS